MVIFTNGKFCRESVAETISHKKLMMIYNTCCGHKRFVAIDSALGVRNWGGGGGGGG